MDLREAADRGRGEETRKGEEIGGSIDRSTRRQGRRGRSRRAERAGQQVGRAADAPITTRGRRWDGTLGPATPGAPLAAARRSGSSAVGGSSNTQRVGASTGRTARTRRARLDRWVTPSQAGTSSGAVADGTTQRPVACAGASGRGGHNRGVPAGRLPKGARGTAKLDGPRRACRQTYGNLDSQATAFAASSRCLDWASHRPARGSRASRAKAASLWKPIDAPRPVRTDAWWATDRRP